MAQASSPLPLPLLPHRLGDAEDVLGRRLHVLPYMAGSATPRTCWGVSRTTRRAAVTSGSCSTRRRCTARGVARARTSTTFSHLLTPSHAFPRLLTGVARGRTSTTQARRPSSTRLPSCRWGPRRRAGARSGSGEATVSGTVRAGSASPYSICQVQAGVW